MDLRKKVVNLSAPQILTLIYFVIIVFGTLLLKLPIATTRSISWVDALFSSTSAMTVTGLMVVDTGQVFTTFGEIVILLLIQMGGLGIMTFAVFIFIIIGKKIGLRERLIMQQSLNQTSMGGIIYLAKRLFFYSIITEFIGAVFLTLRWGPEIGWMKGIHAAIFHSVSAFNNAGISIWSDSLTQYAGDPIVNIVITVLFMIGGLGFTVLIEIWNKKYFKEFSLHAKLMIIGTFIINVIAVILVFILEYSNPNTLGPMSLPDKIWAAYFQGVVPRSAGFNTIDTGGMESTTLLMTTFLMFIGAGSGSTGGGIKLTTFIVMILSVSMFLKGKAELVVFKRTIPQSVIIRSLAISFLAGGLIIIAVFILSITEQASLGELIFETTSAFGTVGMSMGITSHLSTIGRIIIILVMFIGRIGPLTLAFSFAKQDEPPIKYPKENILTG